MAFLDADRHQGADGGEVVGEADRRGYLGQLRRARHAEHRQRALGAGVDAGGAADRAHRHRELEATVERAVADPPRRQRAVLPVPAGVGVSPRLDTAPVLTAGDEDGVDAVHDPLVVRRRAVGIGVREPITGLDPARDRLAADGVEGDRRLDHDPPPVRQVAEDPHPQPPLGQRRDPVAHRLGDGVDDVRPHRVAAVDVEVDDDEAVAEVADLEPAPAPAPRDQPRAGAVDAAADVVRRRLDPLPRDVGVGDVRELDLRDHHRRVGPRPEAAARPHHLRRVARRRHDGRLLDGHRHEPVDAVDADVGDDPHRQLVGADDVLDHLVRELQREPPRVAVDVDFDALAPLVQAEVVEARDPRSPHRHAVTSAT